MGERIRIVFLGDAGVGKTSIINSFTSKPGEVQPTIGISNVDRSIEGISGPVLLRLADTAGQERFKNQVPLYVRSANVVVMVFDLTDHSTLEAITETWLPLLEHAPSDCIRVLVGNKSDLESPAATPQEIDKAADDLSAATSFTVSARTRAGIDSLFTWIATDERVQRDKQYQAGVSIDTRLKIAQKQPCCGD